MKERNYCVYKHTSPSNKVYIGITQQKPEIRWQNGKGYIRNQYFFKAIQKYGWNNFTHEILFTNLTKEDACQKEIELIAFYKSNQKDFGYNLSEGGTGPNGIRLSDEAKRRMSEAHKGKPTWNKGLKGIYSEDSIKKMSDAKKGKDTWMKGKHHSEESKEKNRQAHLGQKGWNNKKVYQYDLNKKLIAVFDSITEASIETGFNRGLIGKCCNGVRCIYKGCIWSNTQLI